MKIMQVPANAGYAGMPLHVLALARGLAERGHDVEVLSMSDGPTAGKFEAAGLRVTTVPALGRKMNRNLLTILKAERFVRDTIASSRPDIVHSHGPRAHLFSGLALRRSNMPLVATAHGSFTQFTLGHENEFGYLRRHARELEYMGMDWLTGRLADRFVAVSEATRHDLVNGAHVPPSKVTVIHNGIEEQLVSEERKSAVRLEFGLSQSQKLVLYVGRLAFHKGVRYLTEAAETLAAQVPEARFVLVGEGPMEDELMRRAERSPLAGKVSLTGRRTDAVEIIAASDLFVLPSLSEGLPLTLIEAAMCGKAMVAARTGGVPDLVREGETGLLVPPHDPLALARAIRQLLADDAARERMGAAARSLWENVFSLDKMIDRMEVLYKNLVDIRRSELT